jgi:hypothetical protein
MNVTLSRGSTSVDIPLVEESGEQLITKSLGLPNLRVAESGGTNFPRTQDNWSGLQNYSIVGRLFDYSKAHTLADLIASADPSAPLELTPKLPEFDTTIEVAPSAGSDQALGLTFPPGKRDNVGVSIELTRVNTANGNVQTITTPTASGSGPITITANSTTVSVPTTALDVERSIGRPNDVVRRSRGSNPNYIAKKKPVSETLSLSFQDIAGSTGFFTDLTNAVFESTLGRNPIPINFNGVYGFGEFAVMPTGSAPFRHLRQAGDKAIFSPSLEFTRVFDPQ